MNQEQTAPELRSKLVTADELAASFDPPVSRGTIYAWRGQDKIRPARKEGRTVLYDLDACLEALGARKGRGAAGQRQPEVTKPLGTRGNNPEPLYLGETEIAKLQKGPPPEPDADEPVRPENVIAQNFPDTFREIAPKVYEQDQEEMKKRIMKSFAVPPSALGLQPTAPVYGPKSVEAGVPLEAPRARDQSTQFLSLLARRAKEHQGKGELEAENALLWALVEAGGFGGAL